MKKQHNAWTNREVELLRAHWPTSMPLDEIRAMLPRHTLHSITGYANKELGLRREGVRRRAPAWERVKEILAERPHTAREIAAKMGFSVTRAHEIMGTRKDEWHIAEFVWPDYFGRPIPLYALGNLPDAPVPIGRQRAKRMRVRKINPFATAAGLIAAPSGSSGRIFQQDMTGESLEDRRAA